MNTPSPLIPQGTFPDNRGRSQIRIAVFAILAVHVVLLGGLLILGCRKPATETDLSDKGPTNYPPLVLPPDTNPPLIVQTTAPPPVATPPAPANPLVTPGPGPTPEVPPSSPGADHVVMKGDSFYTLGKKYGVTTKAIQDANPGVDSSKLKIGQKLKIPAASIASTPGATTHAASNTNGGSEKTYTVKSGDNLMKIARENHTSVKALRTANSLKTDRITVGQKLKIPAKSAATPSAEASLGTGTPTVTSTNPVP